MALNANALATVANFNADTGNTVTATAERFINAASEAIEAWLCRRLQYVAAQVETLPAFGTTRLMVARTPLRAVTSIVLDGSTMDSTSYSVEDSDAGIIYRQSGFTWGASTGVAAEPYVLPGTEKPSYVVTYGGGYSLPADTQTYPLPASISEACLMTAAQMYYMRGAPTDLASQAIGNTSESYAVSVVDGRSPIPPTAQKLLAPYRRVS